VNQRGRARREVVKTVLGGAAGLLLGPPVRHLTAAQGTTPGTGVERLADGLFVVRVPGEANVVAYTGAGGTALVDGASAAGSEALLRAVADLPGSGQVRTAFNTHWHPEQTGSNAKLREAGATLIAHENTRLWLTTDVTWPWNGRRFERLPRIAQPNQTFYTTGTLESGVRYGYIPDAAHTDGDLYVFFPEQNVLAVGDVVSGEGWPLVDYITGGWIGGIVGGIERVQSLADEGTRIVPARGPVLGLADLQTQYEMYATIYERLTRLLNSGRGPGEAVEARPTQEFDVRMGPSDEFVRRAFESLWAYLSPDA
jgi:glyoxylase-like metal-dependent hydrolase (beta-lactamase superfamily II)